MGEKEEPAKKIRCEEKKEVTLKKNSDNEHKKQTPSAPQPMDTKRRDNVERKRQETGTSKK
jgi:hypothetical protein